MKHNQRLGNFSPNVLKPYIWTHVANKTLVQLLYVVMPKNREHARLPYMGAILLKKEVQFWIVLTIEGIKCWS